jgi:hypothetical protein
MRNTRWYPAKFAALLNLRRSAAAARPQRGCPPQCAEALQGRSEDDRLRGSAESRRRIEADFSCAQVDLLRGSHSSDQSTLPDGRCLLSGLTVRERSHEMKDLAATKRRISSRIPEDQTGLVLLDATVTGTKAKDLSSVRRVLTNPLRRNPDLVGRIELKAHNDNELQNRSSH